MSTRETSLAAYKELVESGQLLGKQAEILHFIITRGPGTSGEILKGTKYARNLNCSRARLTELLARGLIREVGQRKCAVSGRLGLVWEATGRSTPLDVKRGHRTAGAKAWRDLAKQLHKELAEYQPNAFAQEIADLGGFR